MDQKLLIEGWRHEEQQPFTGWDFSYLTGKMFEEQPPWSYAARATELLKQSTAVVDLDTGGAERFLELRPYWPGKVFATENYPPNFKLASERLAGFGATVLNLELTDFGKMPFTDGEFDLVLNRHAAFNPDEIARILAAGGTFLTQQVHGLSAQDLLSAFNVSPQWPDATPKKYIPRLQAAGLDVVNVQEWSGALTFSDVGALVYYLKAVPWLVPGFSVETHLQYLLNLQVRLESQSVLAFSTRLYLIEARQPDIPRR